MVTETTARQWVVSQPGSDKDKTPVEMVRVSTTENVKAVAMKLAKTLKDAGNGIVLPPETARDLGNALIKAADMASAPFVAPTPVTVVPTA